MERQFPPGNFPACISCRSFSDRAEEHEGVVHGSCAPGTEPHTVTMTLAVVQGEGGVQHIVEEGIPCPAAKLTAMNPSAGIIDPSDLSMLGQCGTRSQK